VSTHAPGARSGHGVKAPWLERSGTTIPVTVKEGETIFYPAHGVAKVLAVEEREFGGQKQEFYVLELARGGKSLVPTRNIDQMGLRPLVSQKQAKVLLKRFKEKPELDNGKSWKDRASRYAEGLKTGSPEIYTKIFQELAFRAKVDKLSTTETKMLETARSYFVGEVGEVLEMTADNIDAFVSESVATLLPVAGVAPVKSRAEGDELVGDEEGGEGEGEEADDEGDADSEGDDDADEGDGDGDEPKARGKKAKKTTKKAAAKAKATSKKK
jgi:CarD family transcriptional regulator